MRSRISLAILLTLSTGCGNDSRPNPVKAALAEATPAANLATFVGFRLVGNGDATRLYRLPVLEEVSWQFEGADESPTTVVGFASDEDLVYSLTSRGDLAALDLGSGRVRIIDTLVVQATLTPTGALFLVREDGTVGRVSRRALADWTHRFSTIPRSLHGMVRNRLLGIVETDSGVQAEVLSDGQPPLAQPLPRGNLAIAPWGDVVAVATDSGVVVMDPLDEEQPRLAPMTPAPRHLVFSPSGHRIYTTDVDGLLTVIERFELDVLDTLRLPAPPSALRIDPRGRILLAAGGDSLVHLIDLASMTLARTVTSGWSADLPAVGGDNTLLTRRDDAVVAVDAAGEERGRVQSAQQDRWLVAGWDPRRPGLALAAEARQAEEPAPGRLIYVQVSSSHNPDWAEDFAANLRRAGMAATVLSPDPGDELHRVVLGPYPSREAAEASAQKLGLPFWIFQQDTTTTDTTGT